MIRRTGKRVDTDTRFRLFVLFATGSALVFAFCARAEDAEVVDILGSEKKLYSQFDEELIVRDFFQDRRGGFFLDVGAADPERNSTTYYLEKHLGWKGFAIDALPEYAAAFREKRPKTRFFNYIVTDHSGGEEEFYRVKGVPDLSSTIVGRKWEGKPLPTETIRIPTITLNDFLDEHGVEAIDFLSMDIERGAPRALAAFDIERFEPALVCIEAGAGEDYRQGLARYFEQHGYRRIEKYLQHDAINWYFTPGR